MTRFPTQLAEVLRDPESREPLVLETLAGDERGIRAGLLFGSERVFPIHNGIPRFVWSSKTLDDFWAEWRSVVSERFTDDHRIAALVSTKPHTTCTQAMYDFQWRNLELANTVLSRLQVERNVGPDHETPRMDLGLEIGCGNGRHSEHLLAYADRVICLDFGDHVEVAAERCSGRDQLAFVQASALALPFSSRCFGLVFTSGVLMHTPSVRDAFAQAARVVARHGHLSCWIYAPWRHPTLQHVADSIRMLTSRLPNRLVLAFSYVAAPLLPWTARLLGYRFQLPSPGYRDCVYYVFDWLTPQYQWKHTTRELMSWCEDEGLKVVRTLDPPAGVVARVARAATIGAPPESVPLSIGS